MALHPPQFNEVCFIVCRRDSILQSFSLLPEDALIGLITFGSTVCLSCQPRIGGTQFILILFCILTFSKKIQFCGSCNIMTFAKGWQGSSPMCHFCRLLFHFHRTRIKHSIEAGRGTCGTWSFKPIMGGRSVNCILFVRCGIWSQGLRGWCRAFHWCNHIHGSL